MTPSQTCPPTWNKASSQLQVSLSNFVWQMMSKFFCMPLRRFSKSCLLKSARHSKQIYWTTIHRHNNFREILIFTMLSATKDILIPALIHVRSNSLCFLLRKDEWAKFFEFPGNRMADRATVLNILCHLTAILLLLLFYFMVQYLRYWGLNWILCFHFYSSLFSDPPFFHWSKL